MTREELNATMVGLKSGYAQDLLSAFLNTPEMFTKQDADSLFRTLVLDEGFCIDEARDIWSFIEDEADE